MEWNLAITSVALEADIRLVELALIRPGVDLGSARRTYTGVSAETWVFSSAYVNAVLLKGPSVRPWSSWDEEWPVDLDFVNELAAAFPRSWLQTYRRAKVRAIPCSA